MLLDIFQKEKLEKTLHEPVLFGYETEVRPQIQWSLFFFMDINIDFAFTQSNENKNF